MKRLLPIVILFLTFFAAAEAPSTPQQWQEAVDARLLDYYEDGAAAQHWELPPTNAFTAGWGEAARSIPAAQGPDAPFPFAAGRGRARVQQAIVVEMGRAIHDGRVEDAKSLRAELELPRGVSSNEGALILQSLASTPAKRDEAARLLVREAVTWQTTRVRQLFDEAARSAERSVAMPGRLLEQLGEALALADLPPALRDAAGVTPPPVSGERDTLLHQVESAQWSAVAGPLTDLRRFTETCLPSLLTPQEKQRRERLLLKLVQLIPKEYASGVRDGKVSVPLEYREAVTFTQQARQLTGELAPLWLAEGSSLAVAAVDQSLAKADQQIDQKAAPADVEETLNGTAKLLEAAPFKISLRRAGTTADIVDEVMVETRASLSRSLGAAMAGQWAEAERLRVEAYTTYDPDLEARLMPRDPQLATDIERLLLDGINEPGVKVLLDRRATADQLEPAYARVNDALQRAAAQLKGGISPTAAVMSASSIVMREGLEGLLVVVAIMAGLRGPVNARRRRLIWLGIAASLVATALTWILSQTLITSLHAYGEIIEAVTGMLAIVVLLLITNWLFHQVYWRQWVTTLKAQAADGDGAWKLVMVGFLIGYREGFETVLFLQSLILDAGGRSVSLGVAIGCVALFLLGLGALRLGLKLPYFRILLVTALLIGLVLLTFVGSTVRAAQTVGWLPVHRLTHGSWPAWVGNWLGLHNTVESIGVQVLTVLVVIGTWRVARWQAKRKAALRRREAVCTATHDTHPPCDCPPGQCQLAGDAKFVELHVTAHQRPDTDAEAAPLAAPVGGRQRRPLEQPVE